MVLHIFLFVCHFITYWLISGIFFVIDLAYDRVRGNNYKLLVLGVLKNQLCVNISLVLFMDYYYPIRIENELKVVHIIWQLPLLLVMHDILFYHLHRIMHSDYLYKYHRKHHEIKKTVGAGALYAGKVEHLVLNVLPAYFLPLLLKMNYICIIVWVIMATINVVCVHSGYDYFYSNEKHADHHSELNINYGFGVYLCDRFYGTYRD